MSIFSYYNVNVNIADLNKADSPVILDQTFTGIVSDTMLGAASQCCPFQLKQNMSFSKNPELKEFYNFGDHYDVNVVVTRVLNVADSLQRIPFECVTHINTQLVPLMKVPLLDAHTTIKAKQRLVSIVKGMGHQDEEVCKIATEFHVNVMLTLCTVFHVFNNQRVRLVPTEELAEITIADIGIVKDHINLVGMDIDALYAFTKSIADPINTITTFNHIVNILLPEELEPLIDLLHTLPNPIKTQ